MVITLFPLLNFVDRLSSCRSFRIRIRYLQSKESTVIRSLGSLFTCGSLSITQASHWMSLTEWVSLNESHSSVKSSSILFDHFSLNRQSRWSRTPSRSLDSRNFESPAIHLFALIRSPLSTVYVIAWLRMWLPSGYRRGFHVLHGM